MFMAGMPGVGVVLTLSIGLKVSTTTASVLMVSMYLALWPIEAGRAENAATNPLVDLHWVLALSAILFALIHAGDTLGLRTLMVAPGWRLLAALISPTCPTDERDQARCPMTTRGVWHRSVPHTPRHVRRNVLVVTPPQRTCALPWPQRRRLECRRRRE